MMHDCWKNRRGYDRVLTTIAATFLTVSATAALAQSDPPRNSAAELAIDAAVPRPEPANVPPPTAADFKPDTPSTDTAKATTAPAPGPAKAADVAIVPSPPISGPTRIETVKTEPAKTE